MKSDAITKGYESLNNKQRAALFFHYMTLEDELEATRVLSSVPTRSYTLRDMEFIKWTDGLALMANEFCQEHWIAKHGLVAAILRLKIHSTQKEAWEELEAISEEIQHWQRLLLSLDAALAAVAVQFGFDVQCVYKKARSMPYQTAQADVTEDAELVAVWTENFNLMVESSFG